MRSRKAGLPCNTSSEARMTRTKNFLRQNFFKVFLKTTFFPRFMSPWSLWAENIFSIFEVRTRGFPYYVRQCPLMAQKKRLLSHRILKRTGHKRTWADKHDETFLQMIKDSSRNRPKIRLNPVPAGYPASKSGSGSGWKKFAGFQCFYRRNQKKIFGF